MSWESTSSSKVSLGGKSSKHEDRGRFLERQRAERKKREDERARLKAAGEIQRKWRAHTDLKQARKVRRDRWDKQAADVSKVERILVAAGKPKGKIYAAALSTGVPGLLFYFSAEDIERFRVLTRWLDSVTQDEPASSPLVALASANSEERLKWAVRVRGLLRLAAGQRLLPEGASILDCLGSALGVVSQEAEGLERFRASLRMILCGPDLSAYLAEVLGAFGSTRGCRPFDAPELFPLLLAAPSVIDRLGEAALPGETVVPSTSLPQAKAVGGIPLAVHALGNAMSLLARASLAGRSLEYALTILVWAQGQAGGVSPSEVGLVADEISRHLQNPEFIIKLVQSLPASPPLPRFAAVLRLFFHQGESQAKTDAASLLAFKTRLSSSLAQVFVEAGDKVGGGEALFRADAASGYASDMSVVIWALASIYPLQMQVLYDEEFLGEENILSPAMLRRVALLLNRFAYAMVIANANPPYRSSLIKFVRDLHSRDARTHFMSSSDEWLVTRSRVLDRAAAPSLDGAARPSSAEDESLERALRQLTPSGAAPAAAANEDVVMDEDEAMENDDEDAQAEREMVGRGSEMLELVLLHIPHVLPFEDRVNIFLRRIQADQENRDVGRSPFFQQEFKRIRRTDMLRDGLTAFSELREDELRDQFRVQFLGADGEPEPGIDGGGLFKEFFVQLSREAFDPEKGLFKEVADRQLFPDVDAPQKFGPSYREYMRFLGQFIGKSLYEQVLLEPVFSPVFLNAILGRRSSVHDVASLDEQVHKSLLWLKKCPAEQVEDLGLTLSVTEQGRTVDLVPNGQNIPVTAENRTMYIHLVAYYRCNLQVKPMVNAFAEGLKAVIPERWLSSFAPRELNLLISGVSQGGFDVEDLYANTVYSQGYSPTHPTIQLFWVLVREMSTDDRAHFLMFVTSCSRAPLLGFQKLYPKFAIHKVPDLTRLPTASTCANLLKLPAYTDYGTLKAKLMQSIYSGAGFDMS